MQLLIEVNGTPISAIYSSIKIDKALAGRTSTASFTVVNQDLTSTLTEFQECTVSNAGTGAKVFRGYITTINAIQKSGALQWLNVTAIGLEYLLANAVVNLSWTAASDRTIIQAAFTSALPEITTTNATVAQLATGLTFIAKDISLTQLLENLCLVTGGEFRVQEDKSLSYRAAGSVMAPFGFSQ